MHRYSANELTERI